MTLLTHFPMFQQAWFVNDLDASIYRDMYAPPSVRHVAASTRAVASWRQPVPGTPGSAMTRDSRDRGGTT
jgi:hypothetical protein